MSPAERNPDPAKRLSFGALKSSPPVDLTLDRSRRPATEFDRFEGVTRKRVNTRKSEADEKRKTS